MDLQTEHAQDVSERLEAKAAERALLRRDAVTILQFLRDRPVAGTQATGNLPLRVLHEINAQLTPPMILEDRIGDKVFYPRSEEHVWRIWFPHILTQAAGLVSGGRARRIRLTRAGERFLAKDSVEQIQILFKTWWHRINWLIAYPYTGMGNALPPGFSMKVLAHLKRLPVGERISFDEFADQVIETTGLQWTSVDPTFHRIALHGAVNRMVIGILAQFGAVKEYYRPRRLGKGTIKELATFQITPLGRSLLDSLG